MRKWQQKEILEILDKLEILHLAIHNCVSKYNYEKALHLLTECQESAINVGTVIEQIEGECCDKISFFEEYCELLYIISIEMRDIHKCDNDFLMLNESLKKIRKSMIEDIVITREVVFFPYKSSMWDSLESIYLAANEDPHCDAYCVPVPYFSKNQNGSFKTMFYEGKEFPDNIKVTDWQTFCFEEHRPDIIFTHNPYDEFNFVTSVHPRFYSSNLRKYTENLVYVPYFVLDDIHPDEQEKIERIKHFCYTPGTIYANKVILQSDNIRKIYINEYMKVVKEQGVKLSREILEERFIAIGSPKFDLINKGEVNNIPERWKEIIFKKNGNIKKIILYNTSLAGFLKYDERMIDKMEYVFSVFKRYVDEVALWWRPHPLLKETIISMRPRLWGQYEELLNNYQAEYWGIYDDTADIHRAIDMSDAYYGDESSVITMYQKTGKPIMIHNVTSEDLLF